MSSTRTHVHLTHEQRDAVSELTQGKDVTTAEIVRRAVDAYLEAGLNDRSAALPATFGAIPGAETASRDVWDRV